jgi:2-dehydropantoate 2-reductase
MKGNFMKIAVMGTGGMGAYYGGYLAANGCDVTFIARGKHLDNIKTNGLWIKGDNGDIHISPASATDKPESIGPVDVILFCVKLYDTETAANAILPLMKDDTKVISFLNGIDGPERIENIVGKKHVVGGAAYASAVIEQPGVVRYKGTKGHFKIGYLDGVGNDNLKEFQELYSSTPIECEITNDITATLWDKFTLLATNSGLSCLCRKPVGIIYNDESLLELARNMMEEVKLLALCQNINIDKDIIEKSIAWSKSAPSDLYASMYHDLKKGKPLELGGMSGYVTKLGQQLNVPTPCHKTVFACLKPYINGE